MLTEANCKRIVVNVIVNIMVISRSFQDTHSKLIHGKELNNKCSVKTEQIGSYNVRRGWRSRSEMVRRTRYMVMRNAVDREVR